MGRRLYVVLEFPTIDTDVPVDLKYDNCGVPENWTDQYTYCVLGPKDGSTNGTCPDLENRAPEGYDWSTSNTAERYRRMREALEDTDRTVLYSLCEWGHANVNAWGNETGSSWRMSGDIRRAYTLVYPYHARF